MALGLKPKREVLGDNTPLTNNLAQRAERLLARRDAINNASVQAARRARRLPSILPGYTDATIGDALAENGMTVQPSEVFFSRDRLKTAAGIRDLERWKALNRDEVLALGSRDRSSLLSLGLELKNRFPPGHRASLFYNYITQLDRQAIFVLNTSGFMSRVTYVLGDAERGTLETRNLQSAFGEDFDDTEWESLIQELKDARQYNRSRLGNL